MRLRPRIGDSLALRPQHVVVGWRLVAALWLGKRLRDALGWVLLSPRRTGALVAILAVVYGYNRVGWVPFAVAAGIVVVTLTVWPIVDRPTFDRWVRFPARARRRRFRYSRAWENATTTAGLTIRRRNVEHLPELLRIRSTDQVDRVRVRMLPGQTVLGWAEATDQLAQTFGVADMRARTVPGRPHEVELLAVVRDPLDRIVPVPPVSEEVDLRVLPVGVREDGNPLTLPILGSHLLVAGVTGAGKGSVVWATLAALGPAIRDGLVRVWAIDPKGGVELSAGAPLFDRFVYGGRTSNGAPWQTGIADLLDEAVDAMQARLGNMRAAAAKKREPIRAHVPTVDEPLLLIVVDEVASLTAYVNDPGLRRRIDNALSLLLSQGRAPAVSCLLATQDPRKEVLGFRDLVPTRVALRTAEPVADLILGAGARTRGAHTDRIDPRLPGVGYVLDEGQAEPVRVRFGYADDRAIARLAVEFAPVPVVAPALYRVS